MTYGAIFPTLFLYLLFGDPRGLIELSTELHLNIIPRCDLFLLAGCRDLRSRIEFYVDQPVAVPNLLVDSTVLEYSKEYYILPVSKGMM